MVVTEQFGGGSGPILFDGFLCIGTETSILNCASNSENLCFHYQDAGVRCQ